MKVSVWDTYVKRGDGKIMHFDIIVSSKLKDEQSIFDYGKAFLQNKSFETVELSSKECRFCHIEQASDEMIEQIRDKGYFILEMENCD